MKSLIAKAKNRANEVRNRLGLGDEPVPNIFRLLENQGIYLFRKPLHGNASAMFMKSPNAHLVIINSNKTLGHQIFSAAHELSHFLYDNHIMGGVCTVDKYNQDIEIEKLADMFASHFLMPENGLLNHILRRTNNGKDDLDTSDIIFLQQHFNVSWSAMLYRLFTLGYITQSEYEYYKETVRVKKEAVKYGYSTELYEIDGKETYSQHYIEKVMEAYQNDEISRQKLEEYLNDVGISLSELEVDEESHLSEGEGDEYA